jgi:prophage DNA circulation protein
MAVRDEWEQQLLDAEYGGFPLDILDTSDNFSRALVRHTHPNIDGAILRDMGAEPRETTCTIVFIPPRVLDRMLEFISLCSTGKAERFVHPLTGSYLARPENIRLTGRGQDRDYVTLSVTFVEDRSGGVTFYDLAVGLDDVGAVASAATELDTAIAAAGEDAVTVGTDSVALAESWDASTTLNARQINLELAEQANAIQDAADALDLATDVDNYPMMRSFARLQNNLRNLAARFISAAPKLTTYTVRMTRPLIAVCQDLYGGTQARERCDRILELNDIPNPGLVEAGVVLTVEVA